MYKYLNFANTMTVDKAYVLTNAALRLRKGGQDIMDNTKKNNADTNNKSNRTEFADDFNNCNNTTNNTKNNKNK